MSTATDPIADMLSRIRNAIAVNNDAVVLPHSKVKESIALLLKENQYLDEVSVEDAPVGKTIKLVLNKPYTNSKITEIKRISSPGRRNYSSVDNLPTIKRGRGIVIVSTSKGMMTGKDARKLGIGGELICKVY